MNISKLEIAIIISSTKCYFKKSSMAMLCVWWVMVVTFCLILPILGRIASVVFRWLGYDLWLV